MPSKVFGTSIPTKLTSTHKYFLPLKLKSANPLGTSTVFLYSIGLVILFLLLLTP